MNAVVERRKETERAEGKKAHAVGYGSYLIIPLRYDGSMKDADVFQDS